MTMSQILNRTADQAFALTADPDLAELALRTSAAALSWAWGKPAQQLYEYMRDEYNALVTERDMQKLANWEGGSK